MPAFEYDPRKSKLNKDRHGVNFEESKLLWQDTHAIIPEKNVLGENRSAILGKIKGKVHIAIYTERDERIRIISCHRVEPKWEALYEEIKEE